MSNSYKSSSSRKASTASQQPPPRQATLARFAEPSMPEGLPVFARQHKDCWSSKCDSLFSRYSHARCLVSSVYTSDEAKACFLFAMSDPTGGFARYMYFMTEYHSRMTLPNRTEPITIPTQTIRLPTTPAPSPPSSPQTQALPSPSILDSPPMPPLEVVVSCLDDDCYNCPHHLSL